MLLGIVLHATLHYLDASLIQDVIPDTKVTPPEASQWLVVMVIWIHAWRMPLFFLLAGYFSALILERRGTRAFLLDRAQRVLAVLVVFHLLLASLFDRPFGTLDHLWFLYFLALFCLFAPLVPQTWGARAFRQGRDLLWCLPIFLAAGLIGRRDLWHRIPEQIGEIEWRGMILYGSFFLAGLLLWRGKDALTCLRQAKYWAALLLVGSLGVAITAESVGDITAFTPRSGKEIIVIQAGIALASFGWAFGLIGLFRMLIWRKAIWISGLLELSYPIYLLHLYFAIGTSAYLVAAGWPQMTTVLTASLMTFIIAALIYLIAIRHTPLNWLLQGRQKTRLFWKKSVLK